MLWPGPEFPTVKRGSAYARYQTCQALSHAGNHLPAGVATGFSPWIQEKIICRQAPYRCWHRHPHNPHNWCTGSGSSHPSLWGPGSVNRRGGREMAQRVRRNCLLWKQFFCFWIFWAIPWKKKSSQALITIQRDKSRNKKRYPIKTQWPKPFRHPSKVQWAGNDFSGLPGKRPGDLKMLNNPRACLKNSPR